MPRAVRRQRRGHTAGLIDRGGLRNDRRSLISISGGRYFLDRSSDHPDPPHAGLKPACVWVMLACDTKLRGMKSMVRSMWRKK